MRRILVVDDKEEMRRALSKILQEKDHEVCSVSNGKEAVKELEANRYDMVITDVKMPEMNGIELTKYVKLKFPEVIVVIMSSAIIEGAKEAGADLCLDKSDMYNFIMNMDSWIGQVNWIT